MRRFWAVAAGLGGLFMASAAWPAQPLLIYGGTIHTGGLQDQVVQAVVVKDGRIAFAGALAAARSRAPDARRIDLKGSAAYPGFVDAHAHLTEIGMRELILNLEQVKSIDELVRTARAYAQAHPGTGPVFGRGWIETHWPEHRFPTRDDLDRAVPDRPLVLERSDGHALAANSKALEMGGVSASTPDPKGGQIFRDKSGRPTGMLIDNAMSLIESKLPPVSPELTAQALEKANQVYAARGWTGAGFMSVSAQDLQALDSLAAAGRFRLRADAYLDLAAAGRVLKQGPYADATGRVRVMGIKVFMDGALGSRGAALLQPYADDPSSRGLIKLDHDQILPVMRQALKSGAQFATHAIGDRANRMILDWYGEAMAAVPPSARARPSPRWRVEHAQIVNPSDIDRFAALGVIASMQPSHAIGDFYFAPARLGEARLKGAYAWRSLLESGAVVAAGTDAPVEKGDPLIEFYAAVYRHALNGFAAPDWHLEEAVSREQALRMLTWGPAYAAFHDKELGSLEPGKLADITVFSKDIMTVPPADILKAHAVMTMVGGEIVWQAKDAQRR
jgi:predicted amidohydrolase YtcJ